MEAESSDACSLWIGNALYSDQEGRQLGSSGSVSQSNYCCKDLFCQMPTLTRNSIAIIPVEPISSSIGTVALATLLSSCLECFDDFQTAELFTNDLDLLLAKLDCQKERLVTWGELVGISESTEEGRHPDLDSSKGELMQRCLQSIELLFADADKLRKEYEMQTTKHNHLSFVAQPQL